MRLTLSHKRVIILLCCCTVPLSQRVHAQNSEPPYPVKPVRFVVGQAPGGAADLVARAVTARLSEIIGQTMIVDNRTGAAGAIGAGFVAKSAPDGYTLLAVTSGYTIYPSLYANLPFDPLKDLAPIILLAEAPFLLVVHPSLPARSVKELVVLGKAKPDALNYASGGNGSSGHLAGVLFQNATGIRMVHVPHKGASPAMSDTIAGQVQLTFASIISSQPFVRAARLRALAVTSAKRSVAMPEVPTVAEASASDYATTSWYGVLAPAGARTNVIQRMNNELNKVIALPEVRQKLAADGAEPVGGSPEVFQKHLVTEIAKWARVIKAAGIRVE
jgi:tripartite-type tricarboxylate transporter receptor subunit TctC